MVRASNRESRADADAIDAAIARRLKALRKAHRLTGSQVAAKLDIQPKQVSKYENGTTRLNPTLLYKFSRLYSIEVSDLYPAQSSNQELALASTNRLSTLLRDFASITHPALRRALLLASRSFREASSNPESWSAASEADAGTGKLDAPKRRREP